MCGQCCITRKGRSLREGRTRIETGANRDSQIYLPSPSLIDLDRPPILSSSFSRKYSNIAGSTITSILFQEYGMMRDENDSHGERRRKTKEGGSDFGIGGEDLWREPGMVSGL